MINSKQQAFKNHNLLNARNEAKTVASQDQVANPAQVQNDISVEGPKDQFLPSPEVSPLYNRENELQEHFHPMNHYNRPTNQDARYPTETTFSSNPILDTRWLGGSQSPNEIPRHPIVSMPPSQFHQGRNTNANFPFFHQHHAQRPFQQEEKFKFPSAENSNSDEYLKSLSWSNQVHGPEINYKQTKGTWKWVPDEDSTERNFPGFSSSEHESKLPLHGSQPPHYESPRPQTSRDRPYSFDSPERPEERPLFGNLFHNQNQPSSVPLTERFPTGFPLDGSRFPTGPAAWPSSGTDTLLTTEEYAVVKHEDPVKGGHDGKHLR